MNRSHALIMSGLNAMDGQASVLCEWGTVEESSGTVYLTHEGSSALSRMPAQNQAHVQECGEGVMIGFALEGTEELTVVDFSGQAGNYHSALFPIIFYSIELSSKQQANYVKYNLPCAEILYLYGTLVVSRMTSFLSSASFLNILAIRCEFISTSVAISFA